MGKWVLAACCLAYAGASAQTGFDPGVSIFTGQSHDGKTVHVVPPVTLVRTPNDSRPLFAGPQRGTAVYPPAYGCSALVDHGGLEISNAAFQAIYWNSSVANSTATSLGYATVQAQVNAFINAFADKSNWDNSATDDYEVIQQYGSTSPIANTLGNGGSFVDSQASVSTVSDAQIESYLTSLFNAGKLTPTSNTIYGVFFPSGTQVTLGSSASCTQFCAYHSVYTYGSFQIKYAAFPYPNCTGCLASGFSVADSLTMFIGHETREAVTDPGDNGRNAWYDSCGYEADDKCAWSHLYNTTNGGFLVQPEYSNGRTVTLPGSPGSTTFPGPGCIVPNQNVAPATLSALTLNPTSLIGGNGATSTGTVTLNGPAPSGGASVTLQSSQPAAASVPSSVLVPASQTSANFTVTTFPVTTSTQVTISGTYGALHSATLTVNPAPTGNFSISAAGPSSVTRGQTAKYTVTATPVSGFTGSVGLSLSGQPPRSSSSFNPPSIVLTSSTPSGASVLTITTANNTGRGNYTLTITGTSGTLSHSTQVHLQVN